jgi:DNA processing protein
LTELEALIALSTVPHLGSVKIRLLTHYFGSATVALEASCQEIEELPGFGPKIIAGLEALKKNDGWRKELDLIEEMKVKIISWKCPEYPKKLGEIEDPPSLLYVKGDLLKSDYQAIAIVGTRHPTLYGLEMAEKLAYDLAGLNFTIISGLARGIDTVAHQGALKKGRTIAVIGSGLYDIYPAENKDLAEEIAKKGALISEFSMRTPPDRQNFPQRNRIVSGLSLGTLLVEAPLKSGAMITMEKAKAHQRKRYALPGRADGEHFRGNHALIKQGVQLVENAQDIVNSFEFLFPTTNNHSLVYNRKLHLEAEEEDLLRCLPSEEVTLEEIARLNPLPIAKLNVLLMSLMLKKAIKEYPGKIYKKVHFQNG